MNEKKSMKISLSTLICIIIIILLVIILGIVFYFGFINNKEKQDLENKKEELESQIQILENNKKELENQIQTSENNKEESENQTQIIENDKDDTRFCIENIEENDQGYIITANLLEKNAREISKKEYEDLIAGKDIKFRNLNWKFDSYLNDDKEDIIIKSGNDKLSILYDKDKEKGFIENIAGTASNGLCDYDIQLIKFNVDKNILIGTMFVEFKYDKNGELKMYGVDGETEIKQNNYSVKDLLEWSNNRCGSYEECVAVVRNGKIEAIKMFTD